MSWTLTASIFGWIAFVFDFAVRLWIGARIVRRRLPAGVAWAWLSLMLFVPVAGTVLYLFFGEYRQSRRRQRRLGSAREIIASAAKRVPEAVLSGEDAHLASAFRGLMDFPATTGNEIELLAGADQAFARLLADLDGARGSIDLEFYIWSDGGRADTFAERLGAAARRGVHCRLLVDAVGSKAFIRGPVCRRLREAGVKVQVALPSGIVRSLASRPDLRIHRKIAVIDGAIAYTGSMNLADPKFFKITAGVGEWVDALARVRGPAVAALHAVFLTDWCAETGENFTEAATTARAPVRAEAVTGGKAVIQCLPSGPAVKNSSIELALIMSLNSARRSITLTTPYFVPSEALLYSLVGAARRGVRVSLIVPERIDSRLTHHASRSFLHDLAEAGVRVALYRPGLLHTKSVSVDERFSLFGSLNLDQRSLRINYEISVAVYDVDFTKALIQLQEQYLRDSRDYADEPSSNLQAWQGDLARLVGPLL